MCGRKLRWTIHEEIPNYPSTAHKFSGCSTCAWRTMHWSSFNIQSENITTFFGFVSCTSMLWYIWFCWDFCNPKSVEFCNMWSFRLYFVSLYFCNISSSLRKFQQIPKLYKVVPTVSIVQNVLVVLASFRTFFLNIADIFWKKMVSLECWCKSCFVSAFFFN